MLVLLFAFIHDDVGLHLHEVLIVLVLILGDVIIIIVTVPVWLITNGLKIIIINTRQSQSRIIFLKENGQNPDSGSKNSENQNNDAVS